MNTKPNCAACKGGPAASRGMRQEEIDEIPRPQALGAAAHVGKVQGGQLQGLHTECRPGLRRRYHVRWLLISFTI